MVGLNDTSYLFSPWKGKPFIAQNYEKTLNCASFQC